MGDRRARPEASSGPAARPRYGSHLARWRALDRATAIAAARCLLVDPSYSRELHSKVNALLAERLRFRPQKIAALSLERRAELLASCPALPQELALGALMSFHFANRRPLMVRFLDLLQVPHHEASIDESVPPGRCSEEAIRGALATVRAEFDPAAVELYLDCLEFDCGDWFANLTAARDADAAARAAAAAPTNAAPAPAGPPAGPPAGATSTAAASAAAAAPDPAADSTPPTFTTLDRVVSDALVAMLQGVEGALEAEQADDLVDELIALNPARPRSSFHRGFLDVLLGRPWRIDAATADEARRGWYVAGAILGHGRRGDDAALLAELARHAPLVRALLASHGDFTRPLREPLFDLFWRHGRVADAIGLVSAPVVAEQGPAFAARLLRAAAVLLRDEKSGDADRLLTALERALPALRDHPQHDPLFELHLGRRRAHCHRLRGDREQARALLEALTAEEEGSLLSEIHADLGVLAAGYRTLAEVALPREEAELKALATTLAAGERHFDDAVRLRGERGHGEFLLGMLRYAGGDAARAIPLLESAVARMSAQPETYRPLGTLRTAELALADVLAATLDPALARRAGLLLLQAIDERPEVPPWLLTRLLESLTLALADADGDDFDRLVAAVLKRCGSGVVDTLVAAGCAARSPAALEALLTRSHGANRRMSERFADASRALRESLARRDVARAERALDRLEELSDEEPMRSDFLALLESPERYQPGWEIEEARAARIRLLVRAGRDDAAAALLAESFHKLLAESGDGAIAAAEDVLREIEVLGQAEIAEPLAQRLAAAKRAADPPPLLDAATRATARTRVLFVGGNETQARYDEPLRAAIRRDWPHAEVDFRHTGWGSNWGAHLDWITRALPRFDVVVVMQFVRTQLGRGVRKACSDRGAPWIACTGHGFESVRRALDRAIEFSRSIAGDKAR